MSKYYTDLQVSQLQKRLEKKNQEVKDLKGELKEARDIIELLGAKYSRTGTFYTAKGIIKRVTEEVRSGTKNRKGNCKK